MIQKIEVEVTDKILAEALDVLKRSIAGGNDIKVAIRHARDCIQTQLDYEYIELRSVLLKSYIDPLTGLANELVDELKKPVKAGV